MRQVGARSTRKLLLSTGHTDGPKPHYTVPNRVTPRPFTTRVGSLAVFHEKLPRGGSMGRITGPRGSNSPFSRQIRELRFFPLGPLKISRENLSKICLLERKFAWEKFASLQFQRKILAWPKPSCGSKRLLRVAVAGGRPDPRHSVPVFRGSVAPAHGRTDQHITLTSARINTSHAPPTSLDALC